MEHKEYSIDLTYWKNLNVSLCETSVGPKYDDVLGALDNKSI